ncbi:maltokinase N-terminal cap-like domain-containing protein [Jatrophihabitans sp. DSM 45814]
MRVNPTEVTRVLNDWLGQQRWYAGKSRDGRVEARLLATLTEVPHTVQIWIADVAYDDGSVEHYQVPIVLRTAAVDYLDHALIGSVLDADGEQPIEIYDALHDKEVTGVWLRALSTGARLDGVDFFPTVEPSEIPIEENSLALTSEQSNTSLVFGDIAIMKAFRRIEAGLNPDIEIHEELSRLGARHVARLFGHVTAQIDGQPWSLAMVQEFMTTATDGWQLATASVRDLMAEADLHAEEAGGDFAAEAHRLGVSTAEVHSDLAKSFGTSELRTEDLQERAAAMTARLEAALAEVPSLGGVAGGLRQAYADLAGYREPVVAQRVHGDLHLGQVLRTVHRWVFLDFEGEPAKSIGERRAQDSPIRDVAGMLRSFDYAARHQLVDIRATSQSEFRATEWADRNRVSFCEGYAEGGGVDPEQAGVLLRAFEADKAVYELVYEARNRPNWLPIPQASLQRLAQSA